MLFLFTLSSGEALGINNQVLIKPYISKLPNDSGNAFLPQSVQVGVEDSEDNRRIEASVLQG